jgi:putative DNA primase/helicase
MVRDGDVRARADPTREGGHAYIVRAGHQVRLHAGVRGARASASRRLAAILGGEYFADTGLVIGEKDSYQNIQGIQIYEWGELENMSRQEVSKVKLFISSWKDRFRASFDKRPKDYPRQVVFVGTTNESHYLTDITGNRRFWPVRVTREVLDKEWLEENLEQLLAEAVHRVEAGERFWPTRDEQRGMFDPQQNARMVQSSIEAAVVTYLYDEHQKVGMSGENGTLVHTITPTALLARIGYSIDKQTDAVMKKLGSVMSMLGWDLKKASRVNDQGKRPHAYHRPKESRPSTASGSHGSTPETQGDQPERATDDIPF